jgi:hypothetical protein
MSQSEILYTLYEPAKSGLDQDDKVIARGLTLAEVSKAVRERDGHRAWLYHRDHGTFRVFELRKFDGRQKLRLSVGATVPLTENYLADQEAAKKLIDIQVVARCGEFIKCDVDSDEAFDARIRRIAKARTVRTLDQKIVTTLVDKLLSEGYRITACARFDTPPFRNSRRRDGILKLLFDLVLADLLVHKNGETSWIWLIFDESGWNVIADWSEDLTDLIKPLYEPYLPWKQPGREHERPYTVLMLPPPGQAERGDTAARDKVEHFFKALDLG